MSVASADHLIACVFFAVGKIQRLPLELNKIVEKMKKI
jgi:hypothetical protein